MRRRWNWLFAAIIIISNLLSPLSFCRVWQSKVLVSFFVSPLSFCLVQCNSAFGMNTSSLPAWTQILNIPHMYPRLFSKRPCPEQPNSDWNHWDMGRNQRSSPFLCYCNWTVHASTLARYIHVHPTSSSVGSNSNPFLAKRELELCNKQIFWLGNCPDWPLWSCIPSSFKPYTPLMCSFKAFKIKCARNISEQRTSNIPPFFPFKNFKFDSCVKT